MLIITYIIAFLLAITILVGLHEFGHFVLAKALGVKVLRFSIGFGKALWRRQGKDGTEYVIALFPLGGYVKMLDEHEGVVAPEEVHRAFNRQKIWVRALIILAGPLTNLLFAIIAFWLVFSVGIDQVKPMIGEITPHSIAADAGLQKNTEVIQIDNKKVTQWQDAVMAIVSRIGDEGIMNVVTKNNNQTEKTYKLLLNNWRLDSLKPDPLESLGIKPYMPPIPPVIGKVKPHSIADKNGIQAQDKIISYNGIVAKDWLDFVEYIQAHPNETLELKIKRHANIQMITVIIGSKYVWPLKRIGYLGIEPNPIQWPTTVKHDVHYSLIGAWVPAWNETIQLLHFNFTMVGKLVAGKISVQSLGGPIMIMQSANVAFIQGLMVYITFLAFLSVMLAFVNMLPIPTLDGGHFIFLFIEFITGKPVSLPLQSLLLRLGFIVLAVLIISATVNDIMRIL